MNRFLVSAAIAAAGLVTASAAQASTLTCTGADRELTVYNVMAGCHFGDSANPQASTLTSALGGSWTNEGEATGNGTNDLLTVNVTNGWGQDADGTFLIGSSFWTTYGRGALSFHVGQGQGDPDWWVFELVQGFTGTIALPGTFDLHKMTGEGGGLSNVKLWGAGTPGDSRELDPPPSVPEPGSLVLMGTGLIGFAAILRRRSPRKA